MKNLKGCFSHNTDDWKTPSNLYKAILDQGFIDPCPYLSNFDGLKKDYFSERLYVNPPFSKLSTWVDWCIKQFNNGCDILLLMPSRTDTKYFHKLVSSCPTFIIFFSGRLHFNDSKLGAPFPTMLIRISRFSSHSFWYASLDKFLVYLRDYEYFSTYGSWKEIL